MAGLRLDSIRHQPKTSKPPRSGLVQHEVAVLRTAEILPPLVHLIKLTPGLRSSI